MHFSLQFAYVSLIAPFPPLTESPAHDTSTPAYLLLLLILTPLYTSPHISMQITPIPPTVPTLISPLPSDLRSLDHLSYRKSFARLLSSPLLECANEWACLLAYSIRHFPCSNKCICTTGMIWYRKLIFSNLAVLSHAKDLRMILPAGNITRPPDIA